MSERTVGLPFEDEGAPRHATLFHLGTAGDYDPDWPGLGLRWTCSICDGTGHERAAIGHAEGCTFATLRQHAKPTFGPYSRAVLVVDDQAYIRRSVARVLARDLGRPVVPVAPEDAGWWVRREPLAVLSDLHMDPYYGQDLGVLAASLGVPFAVMSAASNFGADIAAGLGVPFVRKPFCQGEPFNTMRELVARPQ